MANMVDYIDWRGDLTFTQSRLNEVDNVLLVFFSFLNLSGIVSADPNDKGVTLREATRIYFEKIKDQKNSYGAIIPTDDIHNIAQKMAESVRFGSIILSGYTERLDLKLQEQFAAYTAVLDDGSVFVSFRGTDDTLVGWKEDLNLALEDETAAQKSAVAYLRTVAENIKGPIRLGGHSKGGNLAVYAAAKSPYKIRQRVFRVYNNDGPGFTKAFIESEGYNDIKGRIVKLVPQDSVVGMILYNDDNYTVIKSARAGIDQHNSFLWQVVGKRFLRMGQISEKTRILNETLNRWLEGKDIETRKELFEAVYEIMTVANAKTLTDFSRDKLLIIRSIGMVDSKKRDVVFKALSQLIADIVKAQAMAIAPKRKQNPQGALLAQKTRK